MVTLYDDNHVTISAFVTISIQFLFFIFVCSYGFDKITNFAGCINFVVLAVLTLFLAGDYLPRQLLLTGVVCIWALRLSGDLLFRIPKRDKRLDNTRQSFNRFVVFWICQAVWVFIVSLPVVFVNAPASSDQSDFNVVDYAGACIFILALSIETVADIQKHRFHDRHENRGKWCNVGLWKWSRHPNYWGEMCVWWSVFIMSTSALKGAQWTAILSPLFTMAILLFLSGLPMLEKNYDTRFADDENYLEYKKRTSALPLVPPAVYRRLPYAVKCLCCCEFPLYDYLNYPVSMDETNPALVSGLSRPRPSFIVHSPAQGDSDIH